ncbi:RICIN domain-containing protein [Streptomyces sp. NPDC029041]|uniref:RICIN domain-containing protein n=1 Tax=Streptomyces sp. NPDC029041 TaxID=3155727 RepID=UPI0033FC7DDF
MGGGRWTALLARLPDHRVNSDGALAVWANLTICNADADAAHALPALLAESLIYSRPGMLEILPALPDQFPKGTNQQWRFLPNHDGSFRLACVKSGKLLECPGGSTTQGQALDQSADPTGPHQWWKLAPATSGSHRLVNVKSGICVDASNGHTADGTPLIQWPANTGSNQEWQIVPV